MLSRQVFSSEMLPIIFLNLPLTLCGRCQPRCQLSGADGQRMKDCNCTDMGRLGGISRFFSHLYRQLQPGRIDTLLTRLNASTYSILAWCLLKLLVLVNEFKVFPKNGIVPHLITAFFFYHLTCNINLFLGNYTFLILHRCLSKNLFVLARQIIPASSSVTFLLFWMHSLV